MAERPPRPLKTWGFLKSLYGGTLSALDEELFDELVVSRSYGPGGGAKACFVSDPAGVRQVLVEKFDNYPRLPTIRRLFEAEIGTGTLGSEGETWARHRRVATPVVDARQVRKDVPALIEVAEAHARIMGKRAESKNPLDVEWEANRILSNMVNRTATGGDRRAMAIMKWLSKVPRKPLPLDVVPKPYWLAKLLVRRKGEEELIQADALLHQLIRDRRSDDYEGPQDLLWRLAHTPDRQTGVLLSDVETRDEAASLLAAGDATVRSLTWIWYLLALHPDVERRVHEEIDRVLGDRPATPEDMGSFPYLERVLDEVMRALSADPGDGAQGRRGRRYLRPQSAEGRDRRGDPLRDPPPSQALERPRPLRSGSVPAREPRRPAAARLHAVRDRAARVPRQQHRHHQSDGVDRDARPAVPLPDGERRAGEAARRHLAAAARRHADACRAEAIGVGDIGTARRSGGHEGRPPSGKEDALLMSCVPFDDLNSVQQPPDVELRAGEPPVRGRIGLAVGRAPERHRLLDAAERRKRLTDDLVHVVVAVGRQPADEPDVSASPAPAPRSACRAPGSPAAGSGSRGRPRPTGTRR